MGRHFKGFQVTYLASGMELTNSYKFSFRKNHAQSHGKRVYKVDYGIKFEVREMINVR